ncbi:MAG: O-antigen/teichoic acid export membrane protein [Francisellaceae bacterium]
MNVREVIKDKNLGVVLQNSGWLIAEKIIGISSGLLLSVFLARYLGGDEFGRLNFLLSVIILITPLASLGLNGIITRELIQKPEQSNVIIFTAIVFRFIAGFFALLFLVLATYYGSWFPSTGRVNLLILGSGYVFCAFQVVEYWFQSKLLSKYVVKARTLTLLVFSILKILSVIKYNSVEIIVILTSIEIFFQSVILILPYHSLTKGVLKWRFEFKYGKNIVGQSYWLIFSGFAAVLYLKIDQIMIGVILDNKSVGIYAVASRFSEIWYFIPTAIVTSLFPLLLKTKESDNQKYQAQLQNIFSILFWMAVLIALIMQFLSAPLIEFLYGEEYEMSSSVLIIHIWAGLFIFMRALFSKWIIAERLLYFSLLSQGTGAVVNIALNYILIPIYGVKGAAVTTLISYGVASWFILFVNKKTIPIGIMMLKASIIPFMLILKKLKGTKCQ